MNKAVFVEEIDAGGRLDEEVECLVFGEGLLAPDQVEQVPLLRVLQHQVNEFVIFSASIEPDDVFMP